MQIKSAEAAQNSAMSSLDSTFDSLVSNIDTINDALDQLSNSKDVFNCFKFSNPAESSLLPALALPKELIVFDTINDALDQLSNSKDDLNKSMKDLETQVRYTATAVSSSVLFLMDFQHRGRSRY